MAQTTGKHPLDAWLDLAIDEGLETVFEIQPPESPQEMNQLGEALVDPYSHISVSDGGAHTRFLTISMWPIYWLATWVRDRELVSLEEGVHKMSALPAWLADFKNRGTLPGWRLG